MLPIVWWSNKRHFFLYRVDELCYLLRMTLLPEILEVSVISFYFNEVKNTVAFEPPVYLVFLNVHFSFGMYAWDT